MNKDLNDINTFDDIPQIIEEILRKSNYRQGYEWDHEKEFTSCGCKIKVLEYGIDTDDWCIIERDGRKVKIAKRALREWWDDRDKV